MSNGITLLLSGLALGIVLSGILVFIFARRINRANYNQQATNNLIQPLADQLEQFKETVIRIDGEIKNELKNVTEANDSLRKETGQLNQALRHPKTGGQWGEISLQNVFELVGITKGSDYNMQVRLKTDGDKTVIPDAIVNLPGNRHIVIDAKTSLDSYLQAINEEDPSNRTKLFEEHAKKLRHHINTLSKKAYWEQLPTFQTTDFVVMYLPSEAFYTVAIEHASDDLYEFALKKNIVLATPMTLVVLLKAVMLGWQQYKMTENQLEIVKTGNELCKKLTIYFNHVNEFGTSLGKTVDVYNKSIGSLGKNLMPETKKLKGLVSASKDDTISTPPLVETNPGTIQISESSQTDQDGD